MPYSYKHPIHPHPMPPIPASTQPTQQDYIRERNSATELLFLRFMPDTPIDDPSTSAGSLWAQALDSIRGSAEQQARPGFGRLYWGRVEREGTGHEDGDGVVLMIDWDNLTLHHQFQSQSQSQSQPPWKTILSPILLPSQPTILVKFTTHPPLTSSATPSPPFPVTALTLAPFPSDMDASERAQIPALWRYTHQDLQPRSEQRRHGCLGANGGWAVLGSRAGEVGAGDEDGAGGEGGGCYVLLDVWKDLESRRQWEGREEARLLREKWEERTRGLETWFVRLRLCQRGDEGV